ncbi:MAG: hypothetical protein IIA45_05130 [Bacteroidetes bacterium]|nr:hypothetical protein [Bacteroidota bacterium]
MNKTEITVLLYFLKAGYSTRELDQKLGFSSRKSKGWQSWKILKKYGLTSEDKGKLFIYTERQSKKIIRKIPEIMAPGAIDILITANRPANLEKYRNSFLLTDSEFSLYKILSGETKNLIQYFFSPQKKLIGLCQYKNCKITNLDTVHNKTDRPTTFTNSASKFKTNLNGLLMFDLYKIFEDFLYAHSEKKCVCFLCKDHHLKLHRKEKESKNALRLYKRNIQW